MKRAPKALRSVEESIEAIKEQGGLVLIPHPLGRLVPSLSRTKIDELLNKGYPIDAIEIGSKLAHAGEVKQVKVLGALALLEARWRCDILASHL